MADSPGVTAHKQLRELRESMGDSPSEDLRIKVGLLAAQIEIGDRLKEIGSSLEVIDRHLEVIDRRLELGLTVVEG